MRVCGIVSLQSGDYNSFVDYVGRGIFYSMKHLQIANAKYIVYNLLLKRFWVFAKNDFRVAFCTYCTLIEWLSDFVTT